MNKYNIIVLVMLILCIFLCKNLSAACIGSSPSWTAANVSYIEVSDCINKATEGDTIKIPAGKSSWSSNLVITKGVNLIGAGMDNTVITAGTSGYIIKYVPSNPELNTNFRVSSMTFNLNDTNSGIELENKTNNVITNVRIDHLKLLNQSGSNVILIDGHIHGVIDSNYIRPSGNKYVNQMFDNLGLENDSWANFTWKPGSGKGIYYEDNTIYINTTSGGGGLFSGQGGMWVARYNTMINETTNSWQYFDAHGNQTSVCGLMGFELYGNKLNKTISSGILIDHRGGQGMVFYNYSSNGFTAKVRDEYDESIGPCGGKGYTQNVNNAYHFNNIYGSTQVLTVCSSGCSSIPENSSWWTTNTSFNGTEGVGCGTLSKRPSTCTVGVAYWATTQSCSDLTGMVGANPATPISGTLYKCTAPNTWTAYYTPYTYPHPLRTGGLPTQSGPATPTGLKLVTQ